MSVIKITVDEQNLHITDSPKIAAQGVNENYVLFTFSPDWDGFAKVALFYADEDPETVYQSLVDTNGLAVIPWEVTNDERKMCIGVCGANGDVVKTSEILKYKIVKGLYVVESSPPSPGIYEQILMIAEAIQSEFITITENTPYLFHEENGDFELPVHTINDNVMSDQSTWSSSKISDTLVPKRQLTVGYRDSYYDLRIQDDIEINLGTVAADGFVSQRQNIYIEGYVPFSILRVLPLNGNNSNNGELVLVDFELYNINSTGVGIMVGFKNVTSGTISDAKCRVTILYIRADFFH